MNMYQVLTNPFDGGRVIKNTLGINPTAPDAATLVETAPNLRLCDVISHTLLNSALAEEANLTGDEKMKRFMLAHRCMNEEAALTAEDVSLIKRLVGRTFNALLVGIVFSLLDPAEVRA